MRPSKIQNGHQGPQNGRRCLEWVFSPGVFGAPVNFCKMSFLIQALLLLEKVVTEKWWVTILRLVAATGSGKGCTPRFLGILSNFR